MYNNNNNKTNIRHTLTLTSILKVVPRNVMSNYCGVLSGSIYLLSRSLSALRPLVQSRGRVGGRSPPGSAFSIERFATTTTMKICK